MLRAPRVNGWRSPASEKGLEFEVENRLGKTTVAPDTIEWIHFLADGTARVMERGKIRKPTAQRISAAKMAKVDETLSLEGSVGAERGYFAAAAVVAAPQFAVLSRVA